MAEEPGGGRSWTRHLTASDLVALPTACYHVYPELAGSYLAEPALFDVLAHCYRHEQTAEPGRMRSFRMRELIRVDAPEPALRWRDDWVERARGWLESMDLRPRVERASDPFFGTAARLMGALQRAEQLKWELVVDVADEVPQAVVACNSHKDHFAADFGFRLAGGPAHTACVAFGIERLALAVLHRHGPDPASWPGPLAA